MSQLSLVRRFGRLRLAALVLTVLPLLVLPVLGAVWLWQVGSLWYWLGFLVVAGASGYGLHWLASRRDQRKRDESTTQPDPNWPPEAGTPWQAVDDFADSVTLEDYPLSEGAKLWELGKDTLRLVAQHYHPKRENPLLELTVPHTLLIIERASRELRGLVTDHIPLSHQLTIGDITRAKQWKDTFSRYENLYRVGYAVVDPTSTLFREFRREMGNRIVGYGSDRIQTWLLQEYIRKVGYYAIDLYSGKLLLSDEAPTDRLTRASRKASQQAADQQQALAEEPLRILVLGRTNAGKSSLINALFGELTSAADLLPDTTSDLQAFRLQRDGHTEALIFDSPGFDAALISKQAFKKAVSHADLILVVCPANQADRAEEQAWLQAIRDWQASLKHRRPAPVLLVLSHIDRLRPVREWQPPYDLDAAERPKAAAIRDATLAASTQLEVPVEDCVPVCLADGQLYNVDDALWAAILARQSDAEKARYLRCMAERRREESWGLLWQQLRNSGRLLKPVIRATLKP